MIVGEPTLMGGEFGDKDERLIARLENTQYDPSELPDVAAPDTNSVDHQHSRSLASAISTSTGYVVGPPGSGTMLPRNLPQRPPSPPSSLHSPWGMDKMVSIPNIGNIGSDGLDDKLSSDMD